MNRALGTGPLEGWRLERAEGKPEPTARGALLQLLYLLAHDDFDGARRLLGHGDVLEQINWALTEWSADPDLFESLRPQGYSHLLPAVYAAIESAESVYGPAEADDHNGQGGVPRIVRVWETGQVLAFERHPTVLLVWKDVSSDVAAELDEEDGSIVFPTREELAELQRRGDEVEAKIWAPGPVPCRVPTPEEQVAFAKEHPQHASYSGEPVDVGAVERATEERRARAQAEVVHDASLWSVLARAPDREAPAGTMCCSCLRDVEGLAPAAEEVGQTLYAHKTCAIREEDREQQQELRDGQPTGLPSPLEVALQTVGKKTSKARVKKKGDEQCFACALPITPGQVYVRRTKGSKKPLHEVCRDELIEQHKEAS